MRGGAARRSSLRKRRGYNGRPRGCGGIGRRARFRSVWGQPRGGSSPLIRIAGSCGFRCPDVAKNPLGQRTRRLSSGPSNPPPGNPGSADRSLELRPPSRGTPHFPLNDCSSPVHGGDLRGDLSPSTSARMPAEAAPRLVPERAVAQVGLAHPALFPTNGGRRPGRHAGLEARGAGRYGSCRWNSSCLRTRRALAAQLRREIHRIQRRRRR